MSFRKISILVFLFFLSGTGIYAGSRQEKRSDSVEAERIETSAQAELFEEDVSAGPAAGNEPSRAELVMKALAAAYPGRIGEAEFRNNDWAVQVYGKWFYYAEGRLLPEEIRDQANEYAAYPFYNYSETLPPWKEPTEEESQRMRTMMQTRQRNTLKRSGHFTDALWRAGSRDESWDRVKQIRFLGFPVMVHYSVLEALSLVEEDILRESKTNSGVRQWIANIKSVEGWSWRNIEGSSNRSFHSYGAAIDFLPKSAGGLETYWQWTARYNSEWWAVPYSKRLHPPPEVIRAFEFHGFIWGGKWMVYDTMHFEYRPEILFLSKIPMAEFR